MCAAATAFALMVTLVRHLTDGLHPLQVVFFRTAFGLLRDAALAAPPGGARHAHVAAAPAPAARPDRHLRHGRPGSPHSSLMPLAEATALSFTAPIFTSVLAVLILGEAHARCGAGPRR